MGFKDYMQEFESSSRRAALVDEYIDQHELLQSSCAFQSSFDRNEAALREIWRILQTCRKGEEDIAIADIKSAMDHLILAAAERYADNIERNREFLGVPV